MIILVDQDGPLADFEGEFLKRWRDMYPREMFVPLKDRSTFYVKDNYPKELREKVQSIYTCPGFYSKLPAIPGSIDALYELLKLGHDVFICTAPLSRYENCVLEKFKWVQENLGFEWTKRIILTNDKTLVVGHFLIDDRPEIKGVEVPRWEHIVYDYPFNRGVSRRRMTWTNWKEVILGK